MPIYKFHKRRDNSAIRCVIFDMDGLLLDTEQIYTDAMRKVVKAYGKDFDISFKAHITGLPAHESAQYTVDTLQLPISPEEYLRQRNKLLQERFPKALSKPGARTLVTHLSRHNIPLAIATSSPRKLMKLKMQSHQDWLSLIDHMVSVEDAEVKTGKPQPDVYLVAAHKLMAKPEECLAFEDSLAGVCAAFRAGMPVIAVPEFDASHKGYQLANQIISNLGQFKPEHWGLPALSGA